MTTSNRLLVFLFLLFFLSSCVAERTIVLPNDNSYYLFAHTDETIPVNGSVNWTNVTFTQENTELNRGFVHTHNLGESEEFTFLFDGVYEITYNFDVQDTSPSASDIDVAGRVIYMNGTEIDGSVFETDIIKQGVEVELSHTFLGRFSAGDVVVAQFTAGNSAVEISTHGTFGEHPESASIIFTQVSRS